MDALSRLITLHAVQSSLDTRCSFGAPWQVARERQPDGVAPYHMLIEGRALLEVAGQPPRLLEAGDLVLLTRGAPHALRDPSSEAVVPYAITPGPGDVRMVRNGGDGRLLEMVCGQLLYDAVAGSGLMRALPDVVVVSARGAELADFRALAALIQHEVDAARPGAEAVLGHLASALFAFILRAWSQQAPGMGGFVALAGDARLGAAFAAMLQDLARPWTLDELAQRCHMSRATFVRAFNARAGAAPLAVLTRLRMAQASRWLQSTGLAIAEIAARVGYESDAAFTRAFKRAVGVNPGEFRAAATR